MQQHPEKFDQIWQLRQTHIVKILAPQYIFHLVCCLKSSCIHPVCKSQTVSKLPTWYDGGPSVAVLPLPVHDPERP